MTESEVAMEFVNKINAHDVAGLIALMTADHVCVNSLGNQSARPAIETGWKWYFAMVLDYQRV